MSEKMRQEFSKHCQLWRYCEEVDENGFFVDATTQRAWNVWVTAWQASRAALVVELPVVVDIYDEYFGDHYEYFEVDDIKESLGAAGVKYEQR